MAGPKTDESWRKMQKKCFIFVLFNEYDEIDRMRVDAVATHGRGRGERMRGSCEVKKQECRLDSSGLEQGPVRAVLNFGTEKT